jgi:uncharacterized Zn-finger protein
MSTKMAQNGRKQQKMAQKQALTDPNPHKPATRPPTEVLYTETDVVGCDGGGGSLGHPMVYLTLEKEGRIDCPYCGRRYVLKTR